MEAYRNALCAVTTTVIGGQRSATGTPLLQCLGLRVDPQAGEETGTWQL